MVTLSEGDVSQIKKELNDQNITYNNEGHRLCQNKYDCYKDRHRMFMMHSDAPNEAVKYTSIILVCYVIGMILLLLHFVKQKYGQVRSANINLWLIIAIMKIPNLGFLAIDSLHKNYKKTRSDD